MRTSRLSISRTDAVGAVRGVQPRTAFSRGRSFNRCMETVQYGLRPEIFLAMAQGYVVILNVRNDAYTCVSRRAFDILGPWLRGWLADQSRSRAAETAPSSAALGLAAKFVTRGILTLDASQWKPVRPIFVPRPQVSPSPSPSGSTWSMLGKTRSFLRACRHADHALRSMSFESVIGAVSSRRRAQTQSPTWATVDRALGLFALFRALRPLYPRPYLCTFDSLAFLEFLARHGIYPRWVFGVQADPFQAHCWVQFGETLLNDRLDRVASLAPILAA